MADISMKQDVRDMRQMFNEMLTSQARTEQKIDDLNERLFNGGNGAIPVAFRTIKELREDMEKRVSKNDVATSEVTRRVDRIHWYGAGAAGVITIVAALAGKVLHRFGWF